MSDMLFKKYNIPGPRYTSYPTAPYWDSSPSIDHWLAALDGALTDSSKEQRGAALYIHIPFCESLCTFCGCNTRITKKKERGAPYVQNLLKEWQLYQTHLNRQGKMPVAEIHLGGGTPTWLSPDELRILMEGILKGCTLTDDAELSIEVDPRVTSKAHLETLYDLGFRRLSLGIQDFDPKVQEIVNRIQSPDLVNGLTQAARAMGYTSINYDLIYGLPLQTPDSIEKTIEIVRGLKPDRLAFYGWAFVPWIKPGMRRYQDSDIPQAEAKRILYEIGRRLLQEAGYLEVGMDHFALPHDSLWQATQKGTLFRNFMGYTPRHVSPMIGLGMSSIGDAWTIFAQNEKTLEAYQAQLALNRLPLSRGHILTEEDLVLRQHILNLMTKFETEWQDQKLFTPYLESVPQKLTELTKDTLVNLEKTKCLITEKGRPFLRNVCMAFDARLARKAPDTELFSQTI